MSLFNCTEGQSVYSRELHANWHFKTTKDSVWNVAAVPGTVHTDLLALGKIEDPYYRLNEHDVQWIDKENWEYKTTFILEKQELSKQHMELDFEGLDTYAKVFLNDSLILETDNMFRQYSVDVKNKLLLGENTLRVLLESPISIGLQKYDALDYQIPVSNNDLAEIGQVEQAKRVSVFSRKAGYHFGWDWGPRLVTSGIWKPVKLKSWDKFKIEDVFIKQQLENNKANLVAHVEVMSDLDNENESEFSIFVNDSLVKTATVTLLKGKNALKLPFEIENPKLWWPNGMGEQYLYNVNVSLSSKGLKHDKAHRIGLRTVEVVREPDSIGHSFYFKVNGHPVFMKGANYIPQDVFITRADSTNYKHILSSAKDAHMNMIRVWGGGFYENKQFYDLCDEKGLLVWQDFMFACAMFPGDDAFLENVRQEAIDNVKRLRNHASIALWCGNNEILSAWEDWGWKKKETAKQSKAVADVLWKAYDDIFHKVLNDVVAEYDSDRLYWPSSPGSTFGEKQTYESGDAHYWDVWWGKKPFTEYNVMVPRFMSEFGFQSFPVLSSVKRYAEPEDFDIYSEVMTSHQRSSIGNETIEEYMLRHYKKPNDFEHFLYVSQLLQAHGIKVGVEAHRRNRARCMGSLYWQINDCWPVASWSSIDYYGKWKALHYAIKKSFDTYLISHDEEKGNMNFYVVSDALKDVEGILKIQIVDFEGEVIKTIREKITIAANTSIKQLSLKASKFLKKVDKDKVVLNIELLSADGTKVLADNLLYLTAFKNLKLPKPNISLSTVEHKDYVEITLQTDKLAKNVFVVTDSEDNFSDNFFDMLPNTKKTICVDKKGIDVKTFEANLKVMTLVDTY